MADKQTTFKLKISLEGMASNARAAIDELEMLAREHEDYDECDNSPYFAHSCISAFRDTILALCKGDVGVDEVKDFWFHNVEISSIPYQSEVIKFDEKGEGE